MLEATEVDLSPTGGKAYSVTFDAFSSEGVYQVIVYAKDDQGLISAPAFTAVSKGLRESGDTDGDGVADGADLCPAVFDDQSDLMVTAEGMPVTQMMITMALKMPATPSLKMQASNWIPTVMVSVTTRMTMMTEMVSSTLRILIP